MGGHGGGNRSGKLAEWKLAKITLSLCEPNGLWRSSASRFLRRPESRVRGVK